MPHPSRRDLFTRAALGCGSSLLAAAAPFADGWPQFRGPSGQGASDARGLPLHWSATQNIRWKQALPGQGWSSPVTQNGRIWLTSAAGPSLRLIQLDGATGQIVSDSEVLKVRDKVPGMNGKNNYASPTPVLRGNRIWLHFGFLGTACVDTETGSVLWKQRMSYEPQHGPGGSPVLFEDLLIFSCDGFDQQFVVALDAATGKVRWRTPRGRGNQAYTTPLVIDAGGGGKPQLISPGAFCAYAYDPRTGKELWRIEYGDGFSNVPAPVYAHGLVYICSGFFQPVLFAVRPDGKGNVTKSHVAWTVNRSVPLTPSPVVAGDALYMVSDNGIATCLDARTGAMHWQKRIGNAFSASPVAAGGRVYLLSEDGECVVLDSTNPAAYAELARNTIDERTLASFAVLDRSLLLRGDRHLYRITAPAG